MQVKMNATMLVIIFIDKTVILLPSLFAHVVTNITQLYSLIRYVAMTIRVAHFGGAEYGSTPTRHKYT